MDNRVISKYHRTDCHEGTWLLRYLVRYLRCHWWWVTEWGQKPPLDSAGAAQTVAPTTPVHHPTPHSNLLQGLPPAKCAQKGPKWGQKGPKWEIRAKSCQMLSLQVGVGGALGVQWPAFQGAGLARPLAVEPPPITFQIQTVPQTLHPTS